MHQHGPDCLDGPRSRVRDWWMRTPTVVLEDAIRSIDSVETPIRWDLVARIRRAIAAGTYDTPEKLEAALRKLQDRLD
jgi:hypothetical protein